MIEKAMLTEDELELLCQKEFFLTKRRITEKLQHVFGELNDILQVEHKVIKEFLPGINTQPGKISKGENYLGYPWMILDFPRVFSREHIFAFRTLCWWGNEISFTLHLSGIYKDQVNDLELSLNKLKNEGYYLCINHTPWEYHFEEKNYKLLDGLLASGFEINKLTFLKLSKKMPMATLGNIPVHGKEIYSKLIKVLFGN